MPKSPSAPPPPDPGFEEEEVTDVRPMRPPERKRSVRDVRLILPVGAAPKSEPPEPAPSSRRAASPEPAAPSSRRKASPEPAAPSSRREVSPKPSASSSQPSSRPGGRRLELPKPLSGPSTSSSVKPLSSPRSTEAPVSNLRAPKPVYKAHATFTSESGSGLSRNGRILAMVGASVVVVAGLFFWKADDRPLDSAFLEASSSDRDAPRGIRNRAAQLSRTTETIRPSAVVASTPRRTRRRPEIVRHRRVKSFGDRAYLASLQARSNPVVFGNPDVKPEKIDRPYLENEPARVMPPMLTILTVPAGMSVTLDGQKVGRTPYFRPVSPGQSTFQVQISGSGFAAQNKLLRRSSAGQFHWSTVMTPEEPPK